MVSPKKRMWFCIAGGTLFICVIALLVVTRNSGDAAVGRFADALKHRDWGSIYDLSPTGELREKGVSRQAFISMCDRLSGDLPASYFENISVSENKSVSDSVKAGHVFRLVTLENVPLLDGRSCMMSIAAVLTKDGWRVLANEIPIRLSRMHNFSDRDRAKNLLEAMRGASLRAYPVSNRVVFYEAGIVRYLSGSFGPGEMVKG